MEKEAHKRSSDPLQEHLREKKDVWNSEVSALISELIALKRGMNGRAVPDVGIPASSIKDPLPPQIPATVSDVAARYSQILEGARSIIEEQSSYSEHRHHGNRFASLEKEASWFGSRAVSRLSLLGLSLEERRLRIRLLNSGAELVRDLKKFEELILANGEGTSIPEAFNLLNEILLEYEASFVALFKDLSKMTAPSTYSEDILGIPNAAPKPAGDTPAQPEILVTSPADKVKALLPHEESIKYILGFLLEEADIADKDKNPLEVKYLEFIDLLNQAKTELKNPTVNSTVLADTAQIWAELLKFISKYQDKIVQKSPNLDLSFIKQANLATRWIKEKLLLLKSDNLSNIKLETTKASRAIRKQLDVALDIIEDSSSSVKSLEVAVKELNNKFVYLIDRMLFLAKYYIQKRRIENSNKNYRLREIREQDLRNIVQTGRQILGKHFIHQIM
jgi:hypothetical protein